MVWPVFQRIKWAVLLWRDCHGSDLLQMFEIMIPRLNDLSVNENDIYFQQDGAPPHFYVNVRNFLYWTFNQRRIEWRGSTTKFPPRSPNLTPSRLLHLGDFKEHSIRHKTTNVGGTERSDWTCQRSHSIRNNPDGTSLCSTSLLGEYCTKGWHFQHVWA